MISNNIKRVVSVFQVLIVAGAILLAPQTATAVSLLDGIDLPINLPAIDLVLDKNKPNASVISESTQTVCKLTVNTDKVDYGGSVILTWETAGFDTIVVDGQTVSTDEGSVAITDITDNSSFVLTATNDNGDSCNAEVDVSYDKTTAPEMIRECELTVTKSADKYTAIPGDQITYTINVTNTGNANCTGGGVKIFDHLSDKLEFVSYTKSSNALAGYDNSAVYNASKDHTVRFNGSTIEPGEEVEVTIATKVVTPAACGDYTIENTAKATARELSNFGVWSYSNTVKTDIGYKCDVPEEVPAATCEFYPTDSVINKGESTNLNWTTTNAVRVVLSGGTGEVDLNGSTSVAPLANLDYTLTAFGSDNKEVACNTSIIVKEKNDPEPKKGCTDADATNYNADAEVDDNSCVYPETPVLGCTDSNATNYDSTATEDDNSCTYPRTTGGGGSASPRCELEVSDASIKPGDKVTLTWETRSATEMTIIDDKGNVIVTTKDKLSKAKKAVLDGSITITPKGDTTYTLLAERGRRDKECEVEVNVEDELIILQVRDQAPLVAGISLAEVPYTGFEAGPFMTAVFYTLLMGWALFLAYVLVIPKTMLKFATATIAPEVKTAVQQMKEAETLRPDVFAPMSMTQPAVASTAVAPAPVNLPVAQVAPAAAPASPTMAAIATANTPVEVAALEAIAHNQQALLSSDAVQSFIDSVPTNEQLTKIIDVVKSAKAQFPLEDGWVVINNDRMLSLLVA